MPIVFQVPTARYRDTKTGRFVGHKTVLANVQASITATGDVARTLAEQVASGQVAPREFGTAFKREIKDEYIRQFLLGRGGLGSMTPSDWGRVGAMLKTQYAYADKFTKEVGALTEGQIRNRAGMYINSARQAYEQGYRRAIGETGFTSERWVLGDSEHCSDCTAHAAKGWVDIGTITASPGDGSTQCKSNCNCHMEYR